MPKAVVENISTHTGRVKSDVAKFGPQLDIEWSRAPGKQAARRGASGTFSANGGS